LENSENIKQTFLQADASKLEQEQLKGAETLKEHYEIRISALREQRRALSEDLSATRKDIKLLLKKRFVLDEHIMFLRKKADYFVSKKKDAPKCAGRVANKTPEKTKPSGYC